MNKPALLPLSQQANDQLRASIKNRTAIGFGEWPAADLTAGAQTMLMTVLLELDDQARSWAALAANAMIEEMARRLS